MTRGATGVELHRALWAAAEAADAAYRRACDTLTRAELERVLAQGADGTPTMAVDVLVEEAILTAVAPLGVNILSEEAGWLDRGSAWTLVVDPLDGSANAAAGVPICAFSGALAEDGSFTQALTAWVGTDLTWAAVRGIPCSRRTTGRRRLVGADVSLLRPRPETADAWWRVAGLAGRVRVLGSSCLDAALVADGAVDVFADPGGEVHRLVDLAAAVVIVEAAGGCVSDVHGRPVELDVDLTRRWSGVVAATPELAAEVVDVIRGA